MQAAVIKQIMETEFTPKSIGFVNSSLSGYMEVTNEVRSAYFWNSLGNELMPETTDNAGEVGVVCLNPLEIEPSLFFDNNNWGGEAIARSFETCEAINLAFSLVSMTGSAAAGAMRIEMEVLYNSKTGSAIVTFVPTDLKVLPVFSGKGHTLDLFAAASWLVQDLMTNFVLRPHTSQGSVEFRVSTSEPTSESMALAAGRLHGVVDTTTQALAGAALEQGFEIKTEALLAQHVAANETLGSALKAA